MSTASNSRNVADVIASHRLSGKTFEAAGVGSFVVERGDGAPVVCLHGVPASSFLYRKVLTELATRGLRGIAFDFPGLGLAERPSDFDYSWSGLARWTGQAIDTAVLLPARHFLQEDQAQAIATAVEGLVHQN